MKYLKNIALAILFGAILSVSAYADGKPNSGFLGGRPGNSVYGLSDSCWKVFLSQISASDASKIAADQTTITDNQTQIDTLNSQIIALLKNATGRRDSTSRAKIAVLEVQIDALLKANGAAQMDIDSIIKTNSSVFQTIAENCGRPHKNDPDTTKGPGNGNPNPSDKFSRGHFGLSDSCWNIFLTQISTTDATQLAADQSTITADQQQIDSLLKQIRSIKGSLKDSTVRAQYNALLAQINAIVKTSENAEKDYASIIKKYDTILQSIRQDCGRKTTHKGSVGDPTTGLTVTDIVPNPATVGSTASLTITLTADAQVTISIANAIAQGPPAKVLYNGTLNAGTHTQTLDLSGLGTGVYLVYVQSGNAMVVKKFVIQ